MDDINPTAVRQNVEEQVDAPSVVPPLSDGTTGMAETNVDPMDRRTGSPERAIPSESEGETIVTERGEYTSAFPRRSQRERKKPDYYGINSST